MKRLQNGRNLIRSSVIGYIIFKVFTSLLGVVWTVPMLLPMKRRTMTPTISNGDIYWANLYNHRLRNILIISKFNLPLQSFLVLV